jgi:hypothetical protein
MELWEAFIPNEHKLVLAQISDGRIDRVIEIDLGPDQVLPADMPKHYGSVTFTGGRHALLEEKDVPENSWLFSTVSGAGIPCVSIRELDAMHVQASDIGRQKETDASSLLATPDEDPVV